MVFSEKWPGVQGAAVGTLAGSRGRAPCGGQGVEPLVGVNGNAP